MPSADKYEVISEMAKRRGYFWPSYEIYGGVSGFYTFGPLGAILKRRIEDKFRAFFIRPLGILEMESSIIMPSKVFDASGHVDHFREPMVGCRVCKRTFQADHLLQEIAGMSDTETEKLSLEELMAEIEKRALTCPECGGDFSPPEHFMTMFTTTIGPSSDSLGYGRPEAAQGIFVEFKRLYDYARGRLPFGVVQIGHALRNEISPRQALIRLREFTIMDMEFFFDPEATECPPLGEVENETLRLITAENKVQGVKEPITVSVKEALREAYIKAEWQAYFMALSERFLMALGVPADMQRFIEKLDWERAHYSTQGFDQEILLDRWGWVEISGHNYRTDYDLRRHMEFSGIDMRAFKESEAGGRRFIPHVVEPSFGSDRLVYVALEYAYTTKKKRVLLGLKRDLAPIQLGVFPLVSKDGLPERAKIVYQELLAEGFTVEWDESGSIGRRYARADEVGTPLGLTVDYETLDEDTVTLRDRDTWKQVRTEIGELPNLLRAYFRYDLEFENLGKLLQS
jgi:glycyl-tRNA synthetase